MMPRIKEESDSETKFKQDKVFEEPESMFDMPKKKKKRKASSEENKNTCPIETDSNHTAEQVSTLSSHINTTKKEKQKEKLKALKEKIKLRNKKRKLKAKQQAKEERHEFVLDTSKVIQDNKIKDLRHYLETWKNNISEWKFRKSYQTCLIKHWYDRTRIPDDLFPILLDYLEGMKGGARTLTRQTALDAKENLKGSVVEADVAKFERAQRILLVLSQ